MRRLFLTALFLATALQAQDARPAANQGPWSTATFSGLRFRSIGPAMISGRIIDLAVDPTNPARYFAAAASGGVWKTINNGASWTPVFDNEGSYSIGALAMDPKNTSVIWVGTGEANSQRSVSYGDGIYKSEDGGKSWKNLGLKTSQHISRIAIDPRDSNVVYVASQGPLWSPGGERGLYKTTDGGKTWKQVLSISENTGVTDVVIDPAHPDVLLAASYQRRRHFWTLIDGGPETAIYKSNDAGATWNKVRSGLPFEDLGRITFALSPKQPGLIYASIEAANRRSGIFRTTDFGSSWELASPRQFAGMYFGRIFADPHNPQRVYFFDESMSVSDDGGRTFRPLGQRNKHGDNHVMWVDPQHPDHYIVGCDGGIYESYDRAATWIFKANLPLGQFYDVTVDNQWPFYNVYGGTQDNFSVGGPARTRSASGIVNSDWFVTQGGDGFTSRVDPEDPNIIYAELQNGVLVRYDKRTGERTGIQPQAEKGEDPLRWNWDSPLIISPHSHTRLYFGAQKLYRSDDRGNSWKAVSGDITQKIDRNALPVMGKVWGPDAVAKNTSTAFYSNISSVAESPKKEGLLYVGTDDGWIQVSQDGGAHWTKSNDFPGVPEHSYISRIVASQHDANTVYSSIENHQNGDFNPYLMKSIDGGRTWRNIRGDLPLNGAIYAIAEDPKSPNLLFAGTEYGLYFTIDGGTKWTQLKSGLPVISVRDIAIHQKLDDLVIGTFGRGIYVLDDYSPLRNLTPEKLAKETLFPVRDAAMYVQSAPIGGRGKSSQGEAYFTADNPPYGATLTYYLKSGLKTKAEKRRDLERQGTVKYPTQDELRAEAEEEAPAVLLTIADAEGRIVRRLTASPTPGFHRIAWDLREAAAVLPRPTAPDAEEEDDFRPAPAGPLVMPGKYTVTMALRSEGKVTPVPGSETFQVIVPGTTAAPQELTQLITFQRQVSKLERAVIGAGETATGLRTTLTAIKRAIVETPAAPQSLMDGANAMEKKLNDMLRLLRGDAALRARSENTVPSISERINAIAGSQRMSTSQPTNTQRKDYEIAAGDFTALLTQLKTLVNVDLKKLEQQLEAAGAPYTPGRLPDFK